MRTYLVLLLTSFCLFGGILSAAPYSAQAGAYSSYNAQTLQDVALEMYPSARVDVDQARRAMVLLESVKELNYRADNLAEDIIRFGVLFADNDYQSLLDWAFKEYLDDKSDLNVLRGYLEFGLDQMNIREQREQYLTKIHQRVNKKNDAFASEVAVQLAMLDIEKGDTESAKARLLRAYNMYPYNTAAFKEMEALYEDSSLAIPPSLYSGYLRHEMMLDPSRIAAPLAFADYTERVGLYDIACKSYEYVAHLYTYIYPEDQLPRSIYMPWAAACFNTQRSRMKCFEIAAMVRREGRFDLMLEGLTASVATKMGNFEEAKKAILAGQRAEAILIEKPDDQSVSPSQLAWFYMFASPNFEKALAWANSAYTLDAKDEQVKSLLGYAFVLNKNYDLAKEIIEENVESNQIASLAMAMIKLNEGDRAGCIEGLKAAIKMNPSSLAADHSKGKLKDLGSEYIPEIMSERVMQELERNFGDQIVPSFTPLDKLVDVKLGFGGLEFRYGRELVGTLSIRNMSLQPVIISDGSFMRGDIRIDVEVGGDIKRKIPKLVEMKIRSPLPLEPDKYFSRQINLMTGELRSILIGHPQANLKLKFTVYIDPVVNQIGEVANGMSFIKPVTKIINRIKVDVQRESLITQLGYLSSGQTKQRIRAIDLFSGLMMEHHSSKQGRVAYSKVPVELPLLASALRRGIDDKDWTVRFQAMSQMYEFDQPLEFSFINKISAGLNSENWPERLMTLLVLSKSQGKDFKPVLQWAAENDSHELVRSFAEALLGDQEELETINLSNPTDESDPEAQEMVDMLLE